MGRIIWFQDAEDDLEEIYDFYFLKSPFAADKIYNAILYEIEILKTHPKIAAREPLFDNRGYKYEFRSLVTKDGLFKIVYFIKEGDTYIFRIWCCRRNPDRLRRFK